MGASLGPGFAAATVLLLAWPRMLLEDWWLHLFLYCSGLLFLAWLLLVLQLLYLHHGRQGGLLYSILAYLGL